MAASTPPSRRAPQARKSSGTSRASSTSRTPARSPKSGAGQGKTSSYRGERDAKSEPRTRRSEEGRPPYERRTKSADGRPAPRSGAGARRDGAASRGPRDADARSPRESRPYRKPSDEAAPRRSGPPRPGAPRGARDEDTRFTREPRPYRRSGEDSSRPSRPGAPRGPRDADSRFTREPRPYRKSGEDSPSRSPYASRGASSRSGAPSRYGKPAPISPEQRKRDDAGERARAKGWGSVARKGAIHLESTGQELGDPKSRNRTPDPLAAWESAERPVARTASENKTKIRAKYALPGDVAADIRKAFIGTAYMREKMVHTLTRAAEAYDRNRYEEALRLGRIVADATPGVAAVRELTGLGAYRAERWAMAKIHLRAYFVISNDPEHLPLVMDADRANHRYRAVEKTFEEVQESEPTAEVLAEARIVMAATWADQQRYEEAIELLTRAGAAKNLRNPSYRHVRLWYTLADVYDRAGDTTSAREMFSRVVIAEPDAYDAAYRLTELGATVPRKNRKRRTTPTSKKKVD